MNSLEKYRKIKSSWLFSFHELDNKLIELNKLTENDFLNIGRDFQKFSQQSYDLTTIAISAANFLSGKDIINAIEDLYELLERINRYFQFCENELSTNIEVLQEILLTVHKIEAPLNDFEKIIKKLRIMGISTRIENSIISNDTINFDTFSGEVKNLSNIIGTNLNNIIGGASSLKKTISDTLTTSKLLKAKQYLNAHEILDNTNQCLNALIDKNEKSSETANKIATLSENVAQYVSEIVESIQFQDITRQKLNHINKAVKDSIEIVSDENRNKESTYVETVRSVGDICELEVVQTQYTLSEILFAVKSIIDNMNGIVDTTDNILTETKDMLLVSSQDKDMFLKPIESGIQSVADLLNENALANFDLNVAMNSSAQMVQNMSGFVKDIEQIGSRIELLALNGLVNAAHLGEEGAALSVLAEEIQKVSGEARQNISIVSEVLKNIINSAKNLRIGSESDDDKSSVESIVNIMVSDLKELLATFHNVNDEVYNKFKQLDSTGQVLLRDIQDVVKNINIHEICKTELQHVIDLLREIYENSRAIAPYSNQDDMTKRLEKLKDQYCMRSEREIHNNFTGSQDGTDEAPVEAKVTLFDGSDDDNEQNELDDNIELF